MTPPAKIVCNHIWKVFGTHPERVVDDLSARRANDKTIASEATAMDPPPTEHAVAIRQNNSAESNSSENNNQRADGSIRAHTFAATGHVVAVNDVSFTISAGETFVVMGLSGSGKSTLLRCLPRLIAPTRGQVLIDGEDVTTMSDHALRQLRRHKLSMVFQHFGLFPHRTIIDNVAYGLEVRGVRKAERYARAHTVLELVNLQGWDRHYPHELSGGMQQRVGLARALAVDPEILLFDEPFSALDPLIRREMQDELIHLQQQMHKTIVFITHDFAEAIKLADAGRGQSKNNGGSGVGRIAIMKDGAFVQIGTPEAIILNPANDYVADFTRDVPRSVVLTARSIMQSPLTEGVTNHPIDGRLKLDTLIALFADTDATLPVVDEAGSVIGSLDRRTVMLALSNDGVSL